MKLTIEQFRLYKEKLLKFYEIAEEVSSQHRENSEDLYKKIEQGVLMVERELAKHDLSLIPFEEWKGLMLAGDQNGIIDFSSTKANIDFAMIEVDKNIDFTGCNLRNIDKYPDLDERFVSKEVVINNPELFLSDSFSFDFRRKFYNNELTMEDVSLLTEEQISELTTKKFPREYRSHFKSGRLYDVIGEVGLPRLIDYLTFVNS